MNRLFSINSLQMLCRAALVFLVFGQLAWISMPDQTVKFHMGIYKNPPVPFYAEGRAQGFVIDLIDTIAIEEVWQVTYFPCQWAYPGMLDPDRSV